MDKPSHLQESVAGEGDRERCEGGMDHRQLRVGESRVFQGHHLRGDGEGRGQIAMRANAKEHEQARMRP